MAVVSQPLLLSRRPLRRAPRAAPGERVYAIGDIHGRADLLAELLAGIAADRLARPTNDLRVRLVVLGDFVDRGPASKTVLSALEAAARSDNVVVLLGNHEQVMLECAAGWHDARDGWLRFGGEATLRSFGVAPPGRDEPLSQFAQRFRSAVGEESLAWLSGLPLSVQSGDFYFCHAGVKPGRNLAHQDAQDLLWIRDEFLRSRRNHGAVIVHGHSISPSVEVNVSRIGIDTGAYRTGRLTALAIEEDQLWTLTTEP